MLIPQVFESGICQACGVPRPLSLLSPCGHVVCDAHLPAGCTFETLTEVSNSPATGSCPICGVELVLVVRVPEPDPR